MIKLQSSTPPAPDAPDDNTLNASIQDSGSTDSYLPYLLRYSKFPPYYTYITKNHKKKEKEIDDKFTINTTPAPDTPGSHITNAYAQDAGSAGSNSPYSLRNSKFTPYSKNTMKNQKKKDHKIDDKDIFDTPPCPCRMF